MMERGEIDVKGKGKMHTYFLIRNTIATEYEIMGRPTKEPVPSHDLVQLSQADTLQNSCSQGK